MPNLTDVSTTASAVSDAQLALEQAQKRLAEATAPSSGRQATLNALITALTDEVTEDELGWALSKATVNVSTATLTAAEAAHTTAKGA